MLLARASVFVLALAASCNCDEPAREPDSGLPFADAQVSPTDGGIDAAADAAPDPDDPLWESLPGLPPTCVIEQARRPEVLYPDPAWGPCPSGSAACDRFIVEEPYPHSFGPWGGFEDGRGYFNQTTEDHRRRVLIVRSSDLEPALAAWRAQPFDGKTLCLVQLGYHGADVVVNIEQSDEVRLYRSAAIDARALGEPIIVLGRSDLRGSSPQNIVVGDEAIALEMQPASFVLLVEGGEARALPNLPEPYSGIVQAIQVVGSHPLWQEWGDHVRIAHRAPSGDTELFLAIENGDVKSFATDGTDIAWLQAYNRSDDGTYERIELWTATYVKTPGELAPRKVAELEENVAEAFVGGGWWGYWRSLDVTRIDQWQLVLYRLADGQVRRFDYPDGYTVGFELSWVTPTELATSARGIFNENQLFRVHVDQLEVSLTE